MPTKGRHADRLSAAGVLALCASVLIVHSASAALWLVLEPARAAPGTVVAGRTPGTGALRNARERSLPAFLVPASLVSVVSDGGPDHPALVPIGLLRVDDDGDGTLRFRVPDAPPGPYAIVVRCPACALYSAGRVIVPVATFAVTRPLPATSTLRRVPREGSGRSAVLVLVVALIAVVLRGSPSLSVGADPPARIRRLGA